MKIPPVTLFLIEGKLVAQLAQEILQFMILLNDKT